MMQISLLVLRDDRNREQFVIDIKIYDIRQKKIVYYTQKSFTQLRVKAKQMDEARELIENALDSMKLSGQPQLDFGASL